MESEETESWCEKCQKAYTLPSDVFECPVCGEELGYMEGE
jgi:Zn finger protein HypA/HybF involved in hydrogenase expression